MGSGVSFGSTEGDCARVVDEMSRVCCVVPSIVHGGEG